jgi:DNA primase
VAVTTTVVSSGGELSLLAPLAAQTHWPHTSAVAHKWSLQINSATPASRS